MKNVTPGQALGWALVSLLVAFFALAIGEALTPRNNPVMQFVYGLLALAGAGFVCSHIASKFMKAVRGPSTKPGESLAKKG